MKVVEASGKGYTVRLYLTYAQVGARTTIGPRSQRSDHGRLGGRVSSTEVDATATHQSK